ncbi:hypothetical protein PR202_ga14674 [Eleusine coracana subsp. coracana]|uniref:Uncharacterized protein n=1 Tax=Eleusine coracana subsp. coracana TaxID=191504 RepID=A0AAV5CHU2_ELECO|nr:hypothetical protein PR202_ga14674 [Eleusine coracana subsp. coracana]
MGTSFSSNLTEASRAVHLFKINGYSATRAMGKSDTIPSKRLAVGGYEWEIHYTPSHDSEWHYWIAFKLVLLGAPRRSDVKAALRCRLMHCFSSAGSGGRGQEYGACFRDASGGDIDAQVSHAFKRADESSGWVRLRKRNVLEASGVIVDDSFTVECTITVITETDAGTGLLSPCSGLNHHLGELLQKGTGADVTLVVSGESFAAHKAILASRSPVFMAEFFGHMKEKLSQSVEIKDMEPAVFRAMLHFIYTDLVPEHDHQEQDGNAMAQHLLAAADRYGIERLKLICEEKLMYDGVSIDTVAMTLVLAEQHGCSRLKAQCVDLIAANLEGVMATKGYKHLMASCPSVLKDLLKAMRAMQCQLTSDLSSWLYILYSPFKLLQCKSANGGRLLLEPHRGRTLRPPVQDQRVLGHQSHGQGGFPPFEATGRWRVRVGGPLHPKPVQRRPLPDRLQARPPQLTALSNVKAALRCRLVSLPSANSNSNQQRRDANRFQGQTLHAFKQAKESSGWTVLCNRSALEASGAVKEDSFTVECTITVITEVADNTAPNNDVHVLLPSSSGLHHHLGQLLQNGTGADVSFVVSGESFSAHKAILASRSPVFMAQFFGRMKEDRLERIEIKDMEPAVFRAMLHFIYTDSAPELADQHDCTVVAQHLLAAADRYGLDKLKLVCEYKLLDGISVSTAATTLALAEQHNCLHLKAKCVEFIVANLDAVMATEGYRHLMASCPATMNDLLLIAVRGRNN